jgi:hypothetical protein
MLHRKSIHIMVAHIITTAIKLLKILAPILILEALRILEAVVMAADTIRIERLRSLFLILIIVFCIDPHLFVTFAAKK